MHEAIGNKKPRVFADKPPSANELAQTNCPIFVKLHSLPILMRKPYLKLFKLILNWTIRVSSSMVAQKNRKIGNSGLRK